MSERTVGIGARGAQRKAKSRARKGVRRELWDLTLFQMLQVYVRERKARGEIGAGTARQIESRLFHLADAVSGDPAQVSRRDIEAWLERPGLSIAYRRSLLSAARGFFTWLVLENVIPKNPMVGVRGPREPRRIPRGLASSDVSRILAATDDPRTRLMVLLMAQEGLRRGEVASLQWGDVDFAERTVFVTGKGGHQRVLPISEETRAALADYVRERGTTGGPLISRGPATRGQGVAPATVGDLVGMAMRLAGVKARAWDGRSGHSLRHTAASDMLKAGAHLRDVQAALGHASITTTQRYLPWNVGDLRTAMGGRKYRGAHLSVEPHPEVASDGGGGGPTRRI